MTSRQPTFRFTEAARAVRYELELCADPACASVLETVTTTSTTATPTKPLPAGAAVFWRVAAVHDSFSTRSLTWEAFVGHGSAPHATSWLGPPDFDRNGHVDAALGSAANAAYLMMSQPGKGLPALDPSQTLTGASGFGRATANAGDVNGDGFGDLVVGALDPMTQVVSVFLGAPTGVQPTPQLLPGPGAMEIAVGGAGDVNGDGYADVLVSGSATTSLYLGGPAGISPTPSGGLLDGGSGAGAGDVNGDGFADVIVCNRSAQKATVYFGGASGLGSPQAITAPLGTSGFGESCITAGDVNGDGYADVLVATSGTASAYVFYGSANGIQQAGGAKLAGGGGSGGGVTTSIASAGDVNGDGYADVIVGAYNTNTVLVYHGGASGVSTTAATTFSALPAGQYANSVAAVGDVDGDGYDDVGFAPSQCSGFSVFVFPGSASGVKTAPALRTWSAPAGSQCFGILAR